MDETSILAAPPITHFVYIPFILLIGVVIGFVMGRSSGAKAGRDELLGLGGDDDLL